MANEITVSKTEMMKTAEQYLTSTGCNLPAEQKTQFLNICTAYQLNPFKREIYAIPYKDKFNVIVGFETYLKRAERTGKLDGWKVWTEGQGADIKAVIEIHRKDFSIPFIHEVYLAEYSTGQSMWAKSPKTMIKKVAMSQGFRLCFPDELGGLPYTHEEITNNLENTNTIEE